MVVDFAVAVVVFSVANLFFGCRSRATAPLAVFAGCRSLTTVAEADFVRDLVDLTVAIVVFAITLLGFGLLRRAIDPTTAHTCFGAFATNRLAGAGEAIIDLTVTVIVQVVATFDLRFWSGTIGPLSCLAGFGSVSTCGAASLDKAIVDLAVAVVVDAIADFGGRRTSRSGAAETGAVRFAHLLSLSFASPFAIFAGFALVGPVFIGLTITVVIDTVASFGLFGLGLHRAFNAGAVGGTDPGSSVATAADANRAGGALVEPVLIDASVAVVVLAVAGLCGRLARCTIDPTSGATGFGAGFTDGFAGLGQILIDATVAIVVLAVAGLGLGRASFFRALHAGAVGRADPLSGLLAPTGTNGTGRALVGPVLVDATVAIVVKAVASLRTGGPGANRASHTRATGVANVGACTLADTLANRTGLAFGTSPVFVDLSVAVVVPTVAFFGRKVVGCAGPPASSGASLGSCATGGVAASAETFVDSAIAVVVEVVTDFSGGGVGDRVKRAVQGRLVGRVVRTSSLSCACDAVQQGGVELDTNDIGLDAITLPQRAGLCNSIEGFSVGVTISDKNKIVGAVFCGGGFASFQAPKVLACVSNPCGHPGVAFIRRVAIDGVVDRRPSRIRNANLERVVRAKG